MANPNLGFLFLEKKLMEKSIKRKKVAYCRVSTHLQSSGLEAQVRQIRLYCEQMQSIV